MYRIKFKYLTREQYMELAYCGAKMYEQWEQFRPNQCREMAAEGTLFPYLKRVGDDLQEQMTEMIRQGVAEDGAWEIVKEVIFAPSGDPDP